MRFQLAASRVSDIRMRDMIAPSAAAIRFLAQLSLVAVRTCFHDDLTLAKKAAISSSSSSLGGGGGFSPASSGRGSSGALMT